MSNRIQKIKDQFVNKIENIVRQQSKNPNLSSEEIWNTFIEADHTLNNKNLRWMVETILDKGFLWEDIKDGKNSKVFDTLKLFDRLKKNLPEEKRSLIHYKSLGKLYTTIEPYIVKSKAQERYEEKQKAYAESKIFIDQDGLKIVSPQTEYAAKFWGRGTQWCTSAEKNNMFEEYNEGGPLLICITPDGRKFQAWKKVKLNDDSVSNEYEEDIQFMDEADDIISDYDLNENWNYLKSIIYYLNDISFFPDFILTKDFKYKMLKENNNFSNVFMSYPDIDDDLIYDLASEKPEFVRYLFYVDDNRFQAYTESEYFMKFCIQANLENSRCMFSKDNHEKNEFIFNYLIENYDLKDFYEYLHNSYKTQEMAELVIKDRPDLIKYIPLKHHNETIADIIFKNNINDFYYVNSAIMNKEQLIYCLNQPNDMNIFHNIHKNSINPDIVDDELADKLTSNGFMFFSQLPEKYKTYDRYINVVRKFGATIRFFPEDIIDDNMVKIAIASSPDAYDGLPLKFKTDDNKELMKSLYEKLPITVVKEELTEQQKYRLMVFDNPSKIIEIPEQNQTEELWRFVSNYNMSALKRLPERYKTIDFVRSLDYSKPRMLRFAREIIPNIPLYDLKDIIKANGLHIIDLNETEQTVELCQIALKSTPQSAFSIINISEKERFDYMKKFLDNDPMNFFKLPQEYQTEDIFKMMSKNYEIIKYINENDLYHLRDCLTIEEKDNYSAFPYNIQEVYDNIQKSINQHCVENVKENKLDASWEKEKNERYIHIRDMSI